MKLSGTQTALFALGLSANVAKFAVNAECANACSGHGQCGTKDMCTCDRNWQGSDCSLRTCPFGVAHVDIPKGDLDSSISIGSHSDIVATGSTVYPFGTSESYPHMVDTAGNTITNSAHQYAECSNKGQCDRKLGKCECMHGYSGVACQRASCPLSGEEGQRTKTSPFGSVNHFFVAAVNGDGVEGSVFTGQAKNNPQVGECSHRGVCETISEIAEKDHGNEYNLWDKDSTMGCVCDPGFTGPDCSVRECKYGIDPLWTDDTTARVTQTTVRFTTSVNNTLGGKYALKFFDVHGDDHISAPLQLSPDGLFANNITHCDKVKAALIAFPNGIIPTIECSQTTGFGVASDEGFEYTLTFTGNPGKLRQLEIIEHLDGERPTITSGSGTYTADVYTKVNGEFTDHFADKCQGVTLKVFVDSNGTNAWNPHVRPGSIGYLGDMDAAEEKKLKACLGDSDYDIDNNVDVANWDKGALVEANGNGTYNMIGAFPHAIKVVPIESEEGYDMFTYGEYYLVWYDDNADDGKKFRVANINHNENDPDKVDESYVFTTKGTVQQMGYGTGTELAHNADGTNSTNRIVGYFDAYTNEIYTNYDTSCLNQPSSSPRNHVCVEKGDMLFIVDSCWGKGNSGAANPVEPNFFGGTEPSCPDSSTVNHNTGNIYTVTKVYKRPLSTSQSTTDPTATSDKNAGEEETIVDTFVIEVDANFGWTSPKGDPENSDTDRDGSTWSDNTGIVTLFHFTPGAEGNYQYVSQCSNRGMCNPELGICNCFSGYTGDDCSVQDAYAIASPDSLRRM